MSTSKGPRALLALVHRLACMRSPMSAQDAILSVRALHRLRVYAPEHVQSICEKAAITLAAMGLSSATDAAIVVDTVNSMTSLHAQVVSSSTTTGAALQKSLCSHFLNLHPYTTPSQTLQKACTVLMKLALPTSATVDTRVTNYVLHLVHNRLDQTQSRQGEASEDRLLWLAYVALFPYTSMFGARASECKNSVSPRQLEKTSLKTLLHCAEALVACHDRPLGGLRGVEALQALHLAPLLAHLAPVEPLSEHSTSPSPSPLATRWQAVRHSVLPQLPVRNVRVADHMLLVSRFADSLGRDAELFSLAVRSPLESEGGVRTGNVLSSHDLSRLMVTLTRATTAKRASTSATALLSCLVTRAVDLVRCQYAPDANAAPPSNGVNATALKDCAVLLTNCWQAIRALSAVEAVEEKLRALITLTRQEVCVSAVLRFPDAISTIVMSLGAMCGDASLPTLANHQDALAELTGHLWHCWRNTAETVPSVDVTFLLVACSAVASATERDKHTLADVAGTASPSRDLWRAVFDGVADHGRSDAAAAAWVRALHQVKCVGILWDALTQLARLGEAALASVDRQIDKATLAAMCRVGVAAITGSTGGHKLLLEAPWRPIRFLRLVSSGGILSASSTQMAFRACRVAIAKKRNMPVSDMIKVLAALSDTDLHAATAGYAGEPTLPLPMDRHATMLLDAICAQSLYADEDAFCERCPRAVLLCRCAEAARRCGAHLQLDGEEDDFLDRRGIGTPVVMHQCRFVLDVTFLALPAVRPVVSPTDAAHLLRLMSETPPYASGAHYHSEAQGDEERREAAAALRPAVETLLALALTHESTSAVPQVESYWRLLYLLNANRDLHASRALFSMDAVTQLASEVLHFWQTAMTRPSPVHSQVGALAAATLDSCLLVRLQGETVLLTRMRACLREVQQLLMTSPHAEGQQTALKLDVIL